jgi:hypothetical protein
MSEHRRERISADQPTGESPSKRIVIDDFPASELPASVRGDIDPSHRVRVVVEDTSGNRWSDLIAQVQAYQAKRTTPPVTSEEAVARIRALRDEWD